NQYNEYRYIPCEYLSSVENTNRQEIEGGDHRVDLDPEDPDDPKQVHRGTGGRPPEEYHNKERDTEKEVHDRAGGGDDPILLPAHYPAVTGIGVDDCRTGRSKHKTHECSHHDCYHKHGIIF